jgi:hypothetical protein
MARLSLRVHTLGVDQDVTDDDDALGERLTALVRDALARGGAPPAAVVVMDGRVDLILLRPELVGEVPVPMLLGGLSRSIQADRPAVKAVGMIGVFRPRPSTSRPPGVPVAMVFLEWTDCRWWQWRGLIDPEAGAVLEETETVGRAVDGVPRPRGLGGWWSLGRRRNMAFRLDRHEEPPPTAARVH